MKITHNKVGQNINTSDAKASDSAKASGVKKSDSTSQESAKVSSAQGSQATKVELSSRAQDVKKIKDIATSAPDVDSAKVEKFKQLIAEGKYKVDAKAVADRMVDEHLMAAGSAGDE